MNNEETIIMQPQSNDKAHESQSKLTPENAKNTGKGKRVAATAAATVLGGAAGAGATYAATSMQNDDAEEEQEVQATEESVVDTTPNSTAQENHNAEASHKEVTPTIDSDDNAEPDYSGHDGADPVTSNNTSSSTGNENLHTTGNNEETSTNEVQVLGVYQAEGENGQTMEAAVLTNGQEVAAVVDVDGDGYANVLLIDENHNQQIDEGEVYDISNEQVHMSGYEQTYLAQQEQMQQEHDTFAYNTSDEQPDFNNDADIQMA